MQDEILKNILKRLDILISLQLSPKSWHDSTDQARIEFLSKYHLKPAEISEILDKSGDKISKQLYAIKRKKKNG